MDWEALKRQATKVRAGAASAVKDLVMTEIENKTRSATADTSWRVSGSELEEIARATFHRDEYQLVMCILWQRLASRRWRCAYKGLELLRYLCLHGSSRVVDQARDAINHLQSLESFRYVDPRTGKDEGQNVRNKAKALVDLLQDDEALEDERQKSKALKGKMGASRDRNPDYGDQYQPRRDHPGDSYGSYADDSRSDVDPRDGPPPPDLDDILGLSDGPGAGAIVQAPGTEISLIDGDDDDDDFDPRGFANGAGPAPVNATANTDDWSQQVLGDLSLEAAPVQPVAALPAPPPGMSQPLGDLSLHTAPKQEALPPPQPATSNYGPPGASLFMQNLTSGAAKSGMAEKAASFMAATPSSAANTTPALDDGFVNSTLGSAKKSMNSMAMSMAASNAASAASEAASNMFSPSSNGTADNSSTAKKDDDDMFGGLVDLKNLMLDKSTRPQDKKPIR